jgi:hypothetical protein
MWVKLTVFSLLLAPGVSSAMKLSMVDDGHVYYANLNGIIYPGTPNSIKAALTRAVKKKPVAIFIQSTGGAYDAIRPMANLILELASLHMQTHNKPLMVNFQFICGSGCSILSSLLTKLGDDHSLQIRVANDTDFGFHGSVIRQNGSTDKKATLSAKNALEKQIYQTYLDAGVSPEFLSANAGMFKEHFKQKTFPAEEMCKQRTMVIPPDSCVTNQMEIYKWILRQTASPEELKTLLPPDPAKKSDSDDEQPGGEPEDKTESDGPQSYAAKKKSSGAQPKAIVRTDHAGRPGKTTRSRPAVATERDRDTLDVAPPEE